MELIVGRKSRRSCRCKTITVYEIDRSQWVMQDENKNMDTDTTIEELDNLNCILGTIVEKFKKSLIPFEFFSSY